MAARKDKASKVADSIKALMDAMQDQILPSADDLRKDGWVTARDYADVVKFDPSNVKLRLDKLQNIERKMAKDGKFKVTMYRLKK